MLKDIYDYDISISCNSLLTAEGEWTDREGKETHRVESILRILLQRGKKKNVFVMKDY